MQVNWHQEEYIDKLKLELGERLEEAADLIASNAQMECPVKTGALQESITYIADKENLIAEIGSPLHYAAYVCLGTRKMSPRAYLRKGLLDSVELLKAIFRR